MVPSNSSGGCIFTPAGNPPVAMVVVVAAADIFSCYCGWYCCCYGYSVASYRYAAWSSASKSYTYFSL